MNQKFTKEFNEIKKELEKARNILLVAHPRPDGDTAGSVFALREYLVGDLRKKVSVACEDSLPEYLQVIFPEEKFEKPDNINIDDFDLLVGCDAVERGFEKIVGKKEKNQRVVLIDHHESLEMKNIIPDIVVADPKYSSVCEILFVFFDFHRIGISKKMATALLTGILHDTAVFQHANTTSRVMEIAAELMRRGAPMNKIIETTFKNKKLATLKLWGRAMERAEVNEKTGAIVSFVTREDMEELGMDDDSVGRIAELLNTVSGTKFSLVLVEKDENKVKGSLRSEWYKNVDVSEIARLLKGGGHKLASGFEIVGKIVKDENGIAIK
ncbi:MAG: bifunctional oligoribonuclease/PAP phosphatase NrnA [Candidatus Moranbacteria bacterium]|nr:bifunctional oligoribonuclease/PAP phosphatase NrnA [Candidatus Moranbacteria bacterium]